jgi:lipoprotein-anchoring transpeptidase ErfK/SrfK
VSLPDPASTEAAVRPSGLRRPKVAVAAVLAGVVLVGGTTAAVVAARVDGPTAAHTVASSIKVPAPTAKIVGLSKGTVSWQKPLEVIVTEGRLRAVTATAADGTAVTGQVGADGSWHSSGTLEPSTRYALTAVVADAAGAERRLPLTAVTKKASKTLHATISPRDGATTGIGLPVIVTLDRPVASQAARAAVERRLEVTTSPSVEGAWRWMSNRELHYRGASFWKAGTRITVRADLSRLHLPGSGTVGEGVRSSSYKVGDAVISTVDVTAHTMTVRRNGQVLRVMPASTGRPGYDSIGGTHIVLEKQAERIMDSATVGHPKGTPDYYRELVQWTVRYTNSGTFTHSAPWSLKDQGKRNVSHGCVNLSPENAKWFFDLARRGDVVKVTHAVVSPRLWDAGSADWNLSFSEWKKGSALS